MSKVSAGQKGRVCGISVNMKEETSTVFTCSAPLEVISLLESSYD